MGRLINTSDINNILMLEKDKCGIFATEIDNFVQDIISKCPTNESLRDMEEIAEIMECDADAKTKCRMISNILTAKPHYFEEP